MVGAYDVIVITGGGEIFESPESLLYINVCTRRLCRMTRTICMRLIINRSAVVVAVATTNYIIHPTARCGSSAKSPSSTNTYPRICACTPAHVYNIIHTYYARLRDTPPYFPLNLKPRLESIFTRVCVCMERDRQISRTNEVTREFNAALTIWFFFFFLFIAHAK